MSKLVKNVVIYSVANIITALVSFIIFPVISNRIGVAELGNYNLMQTFSYVLATLMGFSMERSLYILYYNTDVVKDKKVFAGTLLISIALSGVAILLLCLLVKDQLSQLFNNCSFYYCIFLTISYTYFQVIFLFTQTLKQVNSKATNYVAFSLSFVFLVNTLNLLFIYLFKATVESLIYSTFLVYVAIIPFSLWSSRRYMRLKFCGKYFVSAFKCSFPIFVSSLFMWMFSMSDRFFIAKFVSSDAVGVYAVGAKFASVITLFSLALYQGYQPVFFEKSSSSPSEQAKKYLKGTNDMLCLLISIVFLLIIAYGKSILILFFNVSYHKAFIYTYLLSFSALILQISGLFNLMIYQRGRTLGVSICGIMAGGLSVLLNTFLLPKGGAVFAAINNLIVSLFIISFAFFLAKRAFYIPLPFKSLLMVLVISLLAVSVDMVCSDIVYIVTVKTLLLIGFVGIVVRFKLFSFDITQLVNIILRK